VGKKGAKKPAAPSAMDRDRFWKIIDWARERTEDAEEVAEVVTEVLESHSPEEIVAFDRALWERRQESYRYDVWAAAYIVNGGCSDDGFEYFRGWLIAQGREFFEAVLADPQRVGDRVPEGEEVECEEMLYVARQAYENKTGKGFPTLAYPPGPSKPAGKRWRDDDLEEMFPELYRRFMGEA
jgi:hypothetical protein